MTTPATSQPTPGQLQTVHDADELMVLYDPALRMTITIDARETFGSLGPASAWGRLIVEAPAMLAYVQYFVNAPAPDADVIRDLRALLARIEGR